MRGLGIIAELIVIGVVVLFAGLLIGEGIYRIANWLADQVEGRD